MKKHKKRNKKLINVDGVYWKSGKLKGDGKIIKNPKRL